MEGTPSTPATNRPPPTAPNTLVKIAVQFYQSDPSKIAQMVTFDRTRPLTAFLADRCATWNLDKPEDFALQFSEGIPSYITERNRGEIKNGSVLTLCPSPTKNVSSILESINMGDGTRKQEALKQLSNHASDISFVQEFINQRGMDLLINIIEGGGWEKSPATASLTEVVAITLGCFLELMDHGLVFWDVVDQAFINKISSYVNQSSCDPAVVQSSLTILEGLLLNSSKQALVEKQISWVALVQHLKRSSTQASTLSYINAIFTKASGDGVRDLRYHGILSPEVRSIMLSTVIPMTGKVSADVARQVYILQCHLMQVVHQQHQSGRIDNETSEKQIADIRKSTASVLAEVPLTSSTGPRKASESGDEIGRLGFKSPKLPLDEFATVNNAQLVLHCMHHFATRNVEAFRQWVFESFSRDTSECPFFESSVEIVGILAELFRIGLPPVEQGGVYDSVVFSSDSPFEEAYCLAMSTLNKTWKEMKATSQDFLKVMGVLREQLTLSLRDAIPPATLEDWRNRIRQFSYLEINKIQKERRIAKEELESQAEPIVELREMLRPEVLALIGENRLRHMQKGSKFAHRERGGFLLYNNKRQSWYCRLSQNNKLLHYGDSDDASRIPVAEEMPNLVAVSDIKALLTGKDCPHVKSKKSSSSLAFSLVLAGDKKTLDFIAPNEKEFHMWSDGFHKLLGEDMTSPLATQDLKDLLTWEIKLRLLDTEGIAIPEKTPKFPPPPTNFDFSTKFND
ncbi:Engulfment and cell motility protein 2 [Hypsibius exemplaris]|uniref:Engulfment and cell motility protein 2 n=1 Tax=Hypsibius exemplaris TaxID=2072580 RepID=A0A1W0X1M8_HYPEX|nr:Engulfment and cell motility protein 2 [Hypsibius exemplaris]